MNRKRKILFRLLTAALCVCLLAPAARAEACAHEFQLYVEEPTCTAPGISWKECIHCHVTLDFVTYPALGHEMSEWYVLSDPTCTQEGVEARDCIRCDFQEQRPIAHVGHEYVIEVVEPTCTARGYTSHYCLGCGDRYRTDYTDPLGHRYDDGVVTKEPTLTAMGRILYTCAGCGDTYQETIPMLTNPFEDIDEDAWYFDAVIWAFNNGITTGIDETHFAPEQLCTRSQVVTFLWRAAGEPAPASADSPFADVPENAYYRDAVIWAWEQGITTGVDDARFAPLETCTREQVVTFLHRFRGCPEPKTAATFPDVHPGDYYYKAVCWAAERKVTVGADGGNFCPKRECTRDQTVTFLYRDEKYD